MPSIVVCIPGAAESERSFRDMTPWWPDNVAISFHNIAGLTGEVSLQGYSWAAEVDRLHAHLTELDGDLYLLGMSGGATLTLAYIADHDRIAGIGLIEPAWSYLPQSPTEVAYFAALARVLELRPHDQRDAFARLLVADDVELPAVTATAAVGYSRAERAEDTALAVVTRAMQTHPVDAAQLSRFAGPAYLAIGGRSSPMWAAQAQQLKKALPDLVIETYSDRHHLDAPHHADAERLTQALLAAWQLH